MTIEISFDTYLELEKIADDVFNPLTGFMTKQDFKSVVKNMRLENGQLFPLPVLLPVSLNKKKKLTLHKKSFLKYKKTIVAEIYINSIFTIDFSKHLKLLFGTNDIKHPGYKMLLKSGNHFVGGPIKLIKRIQYKYSKYALTPKVIKMKIKKLNLKTVAGFQTRNVPHKAHEYILTTALKLVDGLFIHPLIGKKKQGDFLPKAVLNSYELLIKLYLPKNKIILGALTTSMRYAGPREAVFHAIIRRNFGCTHFLVGRDHAGVGNYYKEYDAQNLCIKLEKELEIKIIKVRGPFYCKYCNKITTDNICKKLENKIEVSGTKIRKALIENKKISSRFMRPNIVNMIKKDDIFIK
jgi:sulfate adenylyltransferase